MLKDKDNLDKFLIWMLWFWIAVAVICYSLPALALVLGW